MSEHPFLFETVQKIFNAGQKFEMDTVTAHAEDRKFPAAYPVITPLIEELVKYCDDCIAQERRSRDMQLHILLEHHTDELGWNSDYSYPLRQIMDRIISWYPETKSVRPSSPFRSVEIQDGMIKE